MGANEKGLRLLSHGDSANCESRIRFRIHRIAESPSTFAFSLIFAIVPSIFMRFKKRGTVCVHLYKKVAYHVVSFRKGNTSKNRKKSEKCQKCLFDGNVKKGQEGTLLFQKQLIPYQNVAFSSITS